MAQRKGRSREEKEEEADKMNGCTDGLSRKKSSCFLSRRKKEHSTMDMQLERFIASNKTSSEFKRQKERTKRQRQDAGRKKRERKKKKLHVTVTIARHRVVF